MYMKNFIWFLPYKPSKLSEENLTVNGWAWAENKLVLMIKQEEWNILNYTIGKLTLTYYIVFFHMLF